MLTQYRYFVAIVDHGSFTAASQALGVTQPTLTRSLQSLEYQLGVQLLERSSSPIKATREGLLLLNRVRVLLAENQSLLTDLKQLSCAQRPVTYVNGSPMTAVSLLPNILKSMARSYPQYRVSVRGDNGANYAWKLKALLSGELDVAITLYDPSITRENLQQELLFEPELRVVVGHSHPAAHDPDISLARLHTARWILPPSDSSPRAVVENEFTQHGLDAPPDSIEISDWRIAFDLVESGDFVIAIPYHTACFSEQAARFHVLPIRFTVRPLAISIVTRPLSAQRPATRAFIEIARRIVAESDGARASDGGSSCENKARASQLRPEDCQRSVPRSEQMRM
jgi:DNA-binding transcriptional LysR family regulator